MITAKDVYDALCGELGSPMGYIECFEGEITDDDLKSVTVDGIVDCIDIADFLNKKAK